MTTLAIAALALVALTWVGYPLIAALVSRRRPPPRDRTATRPVARAVSVVLATRDTPAAVAARVSDLLTTTHPRELLEIVVAVDATVASGLADYAALLPNTVRVVPGDPPGGKAVTLNAGVRAATSGLVIFADSGQSFDPEAIPQLVTFLANGTFGAVSGAYRAAEAGQSPLLRAFWWLETRIRRAEAHLDSLVAVTGAIYAIRRSLWRPLPPGLICDDLYVPLHVAASGYRVGFCEAALASDPRTFDRRQEFSRKVRTLTGMLQMCRWCPWILSPVQNPVWIQFVCHKLLRLATPYLLLVALAGLARVGEGAGRSAALWPAGAWVLAAAALAAILRPAAARRILHQLGWALSLQAAPLVATLNAVRGRWDVWRPAAPPPTPLPPASSVHLRTAAAE